jgi:hypothetical protein
MVLAALLVLVSLVVLISLLATLLGLITEVQALPIVLGVVIRAIAGVVAWIALRAIVIVVVVA